MMSASTLHVERQTCFQVKASFLPCTVLQLTRYDLEAIDQQLVNVVSQAPNFFTGSPVVVDLDKMKSLGVIDFVALKDIISANGMSFIGVRGGDLEQQEAAQQAGLSILTMTKLNTESAKTKPEESAPQPGNQPSKMITSPIRSGMQVYAKEGDLIVTAAVSPGAELFADGHIHVYSALRGRALAGVQGNKEAKIFCRSLEAELVSIAGYYLTKEDMQALSLPDGVMQIYLDNEQIRIEAI